MIKRKDDELYLRTKRTGPINIRIDVVNCDLDFDERKNYNEKEIDRIIERFPWNQREWLEKQLVRAKNIKGPFVIVYYIGGSIKSKRIEEVVLYLN